MNVFEKLKITPPAPRKTADAGTGHSADGEMSTLPVKSAEALRAPDGKWVPGASPNPGGRPKKGLSRSDFAAQLQDPAQVQRFIERLARIVEFGSDKDAVKALELWFAYGFGKPVQPTEISGPDGAPIRTENKTVTATVRVHDPDRMRKVAEGFLKTLPPPKPSILLESTTTTGSTSLSTSEGNQEDEPKP